MGMLKRRTRLVSFRLSDEEYERVQGACVAEGARSISEFARAALQRTATNPVKHATFDEGHPVETRTQELIETMRELTRQLGQLNSLIRSDRDSLQFRR